jgi:hypothetical protein
MNTLSISDLSGIATITRKGGVSLLSTGEVSTFRPFEALMDGFDLRMGIKVSEKKYEKAARIPWKIATSYLQDTFRLRKQRTDQILVNHSTLLKRINPLMFLGNCSQHTIQEVTGKKVEWKGGKPKYPALTVEEEMWCNCADWAYSLFGTLRNVVCTISLNNGQTLTKQF